jgi:alpha-beta hydrolase superfamily lysophospholipase
MVLVKELAGASGSSTRASIAGPRASPPPPSGRCSFFLHGTEDKAAKSSGSQLFYDRAGSTDKTLKLYDGHFHDLLNDLGKETVMADITAWIEARLLGGAKSGADH